MQQTALFSRGYLAKSFVSLVARRSSSVDRRSLSKLKRLEARKSPREIYNPDKSPLMELTQPPRLDSITRNVHTMKHDESFLRRIVTFSWHDVEWWWIVRAYVYVRYSPLSAQDAIQRRVFLGAFTLEAALWSVALMLAYAAARLTRWNVRFALFNSRRLLLVRCMYCISDIRLIDSFHQS